MSVGQLKIPIEIFETLITKDDEGFSLKEERLVLKTKAYKEDRHGSESWKNRASFTSATTLFRMRKHPGIRITVDHYIRCNEEKFNIISVEDIKDKRMYLEVLVERIYPSKG